MSPNDFLTLADALLKTLPCPAAFRSAVSRAYYAAHHHIALFVESAGVTILKSGEAHRDVWLHLTGIDDPELETVGNELAELQIDRNAADYDLQKPKFEKQSNASERVNDARELMDIVDKCQADKQRYEKVKAAIKKRHQELRGL